MSGGVGGLGSAGSVDGTVAAEGVEGTAPAGAAPAGAPASTEPARPMSSRARSTGFAMSLLEESLASRLADDPAEVAAAGAPPLVEDPRHPTEAELLALRESVPPSAAAGVADPELRSAEREADREAGELQRDGGGLLGLADSWTGVAIRRKVGSLATRARKVSGRFEALAGRYRRQAVPVTERTPALLRRAEQLEARARLVEYQLTDQVEAVEARYGMLASLPPRTDAGAGTGEPTGAAADAEPAPFRWELRKLRTEAGGTWVKSEWNEAVARTLNGLRRDDLITMGGEAAGKTVRGLLPGLDDVDPELRGAYAQTLAEVDRIVRVYVASSEVGHVAGRVLSNIIGDLSEMLHAQLSFREAGRQIRELPSGSPRLAGLEAQRAAAGRAALAAQDRLEVKARFNGNLRLTGDADLFFVKEVKAEAQLRMKTPAFRGRVYLGVTLDKPLTRDAEAEVRGGVRLSGARWDASVEGRVRIRDLYTDPSFGPMAEIEGRFRYHGDRFESTLSARASIPLARESRGVAGVRFDVAEHRSGASAYVGVEHEWGAAQPAETRAIFGISLPW